MIVRDDGLGIPQTAHSALAGRIAEAWAIDADLPAAELRVAAAIHDLGWAAWERVPETDPATGLPYGFLALPAAEHAAIWARGTSDAATFGRWPALLVSLHCTRLMGWRMQAGSAGPEVEALVQRERDRQAELSRGLDPAIVDQASELIARWDGLSLHLCGGEPPPRLEPWPFTAERVPLSVDARELRGERAGAWRTLDVSLARR